MPIKSKPTNDDEKFGILVVNAILEGIVSEKPNGYRYVNPHGESHAPGKTVSCYYTDKDGGPSCLVGQVAHRLNVERPGYGASHNVDSAAYAPFVANNFTPEARERLVTVQKRQDAGETWRRAIR